MASPWYLYEMKVFYPQSLFLSIKNKLLDTKLGLKKMSFMCLWLLLPQAKVLINISTK